MKQIIGTFSILAVLLLNSFLCITMINVSGAIAEAREFKAGVVAEIENSNFNPNVMDACRKQAQEAGYELQTTVSVYDENKDIRTAEVILTYPCRMPLFGIFEKKTTRGFAR